MKLSAEELSILASFTCGINTRAEGQRLTHRLLPIGKPYGSIFSEGARTRLYWCEQPAEACMLVCAFRDLGDAAALYRDLQGTGEYVVWRRSNLEPIRSCCGMS